MEDLRSAEQEGPSPSEACQIRGKKSNHCYWDSLEPQQTQCLLCMCASASVCVLIKQRRSVGLCGFKLFSS